MSTRELLVTLQIMPNSIFFYFFVGICLANIDELFISHKNFNSHSRLVQNHAPKKYNRVSNKCKWRWINIFLRLFFSCKTENENCFWRKHIVLFIDGALLNTDRGFHSYFLYAALSTFNFTCMHQSYRLRIYHWSFAYHNLLYFGFHSK